MPIDYNLFLSAVYAILNYLRIRYGDLNAILALHSKRFLQHGILSAPTWMPSGYGEALWDNNALPMDITLPPQATREHFDPTSELFACLKHLLH
jgi:hypothetical protein